MRVRDLTMTAAQFEVLQRECKVGAAWEGACQLLCGVSSLDEDPWVQNSAHVPELRLTLHRPEPLPPSKVRARESSVSWDMDCYISLLRKAREEGLQPGICHSHPYSGALVFTPRR